MNMKKKLFAAHQHLINQGLDPSVIEREQRHELMVPKLALVGLLTTLENFCVAGRNSVMSTVGPLNVRNLALFLGALKNSLDLAEKVLLEYQTIQAILQAKTEEEEEVSTEDHSTMEIITDQEPDDAKEQQDSEDTNTQDFAKVLDIKKLN
jgi:hypothetical protein